jgi:2EXR family
MENSSKIAALLQSELPDPHQDLFFQPLHTFHEFRNLPVEIRLLIWRRTFPRTRYMRQIPGAKSTHHICTLQYPPAPVSSLVNNESRSETLKEYQILTHSELADARARMERRRLLFEGGVLWNRSTDVLQARWLSIAFCEVHHLMMGDMFVREGKDFLRNLEIIELTVTDWAPDFFSSELCPPLTEQNGIWIEDMTGLSELRLIPKTRRNSPPHQQFNNERAKQCIENLDKSFRSLAAKNPNQTIPRIVIFRR